ncbi:ABC transporter permease [Dongia soli]|uniref:FtsX-like permease family protein n=1 Tax=Dongia soli TaxID=600628 RepID=A0ABU5E922_9PROT|nr:FtsX-like permease family protein [Dongia soli]MDY0882048.1 FtsX-like permease family protein [Dongia soli]
MNALIAVLKFAWRDLRSSLAGGLRGFRIFLICLMLGAAVIAAIGSLAAGIDAGLRSNGKAILGGDLEFRLIYRPATDDERNALNLGGAVTHSQELRAMVKGEASSDGAAAPNDGNPVLVEVKAVDRLYPLYGQAEIDPPQSLQAALAQHADGSFGALVEPSLLQRLGIAPGAVLQLGKAKLVVSGAITREPDRGSQVFNLGPRLMISPQALAASDLAQPGSLIYHVYRVKLQPGLDAFRFKQQMVERFPQAGWRIRGVEDAAAGLRSFLDRTAQYLNLVGFSALLIGGLGIANAVRAFLEGKARSLAVLKCLGASSGQLLTLYLLLVGTMALIGTVAGLAIGAVAPFVLATALARFDVPLLAGIYLEPLLLAAGISLLTAFAFALPPLLRARRVRPAQLFRAGPVELGGLSRFDLGTLGLTALILAAAAVLTAGSTKLAGGFVAATIVTLIAFALLAAGLKQLADWSRARLGQRSRALRFALADIARHQSPTASIVLSVGLGLTVLVAIALIQRNMLRDLDETIPRQAPSFYFIDIQPQQLAAFDKFAGSFPGAGEFERVPMLRGRIVQMNGTPTEKIVPPPDLAWVLKGDRGITWSATAPRNAKIVEGQWWAADYKGPPLISMDAEAARGFGLKIGDSIAVNVLGREISGKIANLREIDWSSLGINFVMVFSPGLLEQAPQTYIATLRIPPAQDGALLAAVSRDFPNVSAIRVKEALASAIEILQAVAASIRTTAAVTLAAGMLVLAGAIAAGRERRIYEAVLLKMLGGTAGDIARGYLWEYGVLAVISAVIALAIGSLGAYIFLTEVLHVGWSFPPLLAFGIIGLSLAATLSVGFLGSWRALRAKAAPYLRNE